MLAGLNVAVTPEGMPLADMAMALSNPPDIAAVMVDVPLDPSTTVKEVGLAVSVKLGVPLEEIVSAMVAVCVTPPPVPLTVTVYVPVTALALTVSVNVDEPDPGAEILVGLKLAVTPPGSPLAERATALLNPPETAVVMLEVPLDPC
jgi:hypothetical protein